MQSMHQIYVYNTIIDKSNYDTNPKLGIRNPMFDPDFTINIPHATDRQNIVHTKGFLILNE